MHDYESSLRVLIEESQDTHADAMRGNASALRDLDMARHDLDLDEEAEPMDRAMLQKILVAAGLSVAAAAVVASPVSAQAAGDVQILQTAASIENLAVATYDAALKIPFMADVPKLIGAFATEARNQHADHAKSFNAAVVRLKGKPQNASNPILVPVVEGAKAKLKGPVDVLDLAILLEDTAAATYAKNVSQLIDPKLRPIVGSVMGVEAQHSAILRAVKALVSGGAPELVVIPTDVAKLPAAAGSIGFPVAYFPLDSARPAAEGAVK